MPNPEHVAMLKKTRGKGDLWALFRFGGERIDLSGANLGGVALEGADLHSAKLDEAVLSHADLSSANLDSADLSGADLSGADLRRADLDSADLNSSYLINADLTDSSLSYSDFSGAELVDADLSNADLLHAVLVEANLTGANLDSAKLNGARLVRANLNRANLSRADLSNAKLRHANLSATVFRATILRNTDMTAATLGGAYFDDVDLSQVDLNDVQYRGPSSLSTSALARSRGQLSDTFLEGAGLTPWETLAVRMYDASLSPEEITEIQYRVYDLRFHDPLQLHPVFISYKHDDVDGALAKRLKAAFDEKHMRTWFDVHDLNAGKVDRQIDHVFNTINPVVVSLLSERSLESEWVEWEAGQARKLEKKIGRPVLCPVALDDAWKECDWPGPLRRQIESYNVLDFSEWENETKFEAAFTKLYRGLRDNYGAVGTRENA